MWLAAIVALSPLAARDTFPMMFAGPERSLAKLARVARRCGYNHAAVTDGPGGSRVVVIDTPFDTSPRDRFSCVTRWFLAHPKLELGFLGNAAEQP